MYEKCCWDITNNVQVRENFDSKCVVWLSDMLRRVRINLERKGTRPCWIGKDVFNQFIDHWNSDTFKQVSETIIKNRASEVGGCNYAADNINVAEITRRMRDELDRDSLLNEIHLETHIKKNGEFKEYDRRLALNISEHLELPPSASGYLISPCLDFRTWYDVAREKRKNGRVYGA
ncbi:unnamed protein product [Lathyrus oleraceus]